ncbi:hypothetical protein CALVIDRAFT_554302 [Calocera viscosa TUFC12733]|uniref:Uncharacterized protein n=1 Tax=Calocera viscosa (strain TUFC12733) TaxID=1330018 RepID=A0A167NK56_CALVF|nr:hypothetical protein CALVIDRAFT_554302 [Calocera viscosa TUFC12733]
MVVYQCTKCETRFRSNPGSCHCGNNRFNTVDPNGSRDPSGTYMSCPHCGIRTEVKHHSFCEHCGKTFPRRAAYPAVLNEFGGSPSPNIRSKTPTGQPEAAVPHVPARPYVRPARPGTPGTRFKTPPPQPKVNVPYVPARPYVRSQPPPAPPQPPPVRPRTPRVHFKPPPPAPRVFVPTAPRSPYWNTYFVAPALPMPPPPPPPPRVHIPPTPAVVFDYGSPASYPAPLTWRELKRRTKEGLSLLCMDCGNPWVKTRCPYCRVKSPKARPVLFCTRARVPRATAYMPTAPAPTNRRSRSPHPRRARLQKVAPAPWPTDIDWEKEVVPYRRKREPFDDILDNRIPPTTRFHPAGEQALVHVNGAPTFKLVQFCKAIQFWINHQVPGPLDFIDPRRLFVLENELENNGVFWTYREPFHRVVFEELGIEYLDYWDADTQSYTCGLTLRGLIRYITLWILCEPRDATTYLRSLADHLDFPRPPPNMGTIWRIDASQAIGSSHPTAEKWRIRLHEKILSLDDDPLETPQDPERMLWEPDE